MFPTPLRLTKPGLFITATDTGVGKTVAACAIAASLRRQGAGRVGVCKPFATGCRREREGLVSDDAEALAHFADCRAMLDVINPIRYARPLAPAVAAEEAGTPPDLAELVRCMKMLDNEHDVLLIEGVGGLLAPLLPDKPKVTVLDLIVALGYPVAVVCRAGLGTLNHTAMTVRLLREAGCDVAGLIINGYVPDPGDPMVAAVKAAGAAGEGGGAGGAGGTGGAGGAGAGKKGGGKRPGGQPATSLGVNDTDTSVASNRVWLQRMNATTMLATLPLCPPDSVAPQKARLPEAILEAAALTYWPDVVAPARR